MVAIPVGSGNAVRWTERFAQSMLNRITEQAKHLPDAFQAVESAMGHTVLSALEKAGLSNLATKADQVYVTALSSRATGLPKEALSDGAKALRLGTMKKMLSQGSFDDVRVLRYTNPDDLAKDIAHWKGLPDAKLHDNGMVSTTRKLGSWINAERYYIPVAGSTNELITVTRFNVGEAFTQFKQKIDELLQKITPYLERLQGALKQDLADISASAKPPVATSASTTAT